MRKTLAIVAAFSLLTAFVCGAAYVFISRPALSPEKRLICLLHDGPVCSLTFSPNSRFLVAGSAGIDQSAGQWQGRIKVWDAASFKLVGSSDFPRQVCALDFSPKGDRLAIGCGLEVHGREKEKWGYKEEPGQVRILGFPELKEKNTIKLGDHVKDVLFSGDGKFLAARWRSGYDQTVSIWSVSEWKNLRSIGGPKAAKENIGVAITRGSDASSFLALGGYGITQIRPDLAENEDKRVVRLEHTLNAGSVKSYSDKRRLIYHAGGPIRIVNLDTGQEDSPEDLFKATPLSGVHTVSGDGKLLAVFVRKSAPGFRAGQPWIVLWDLVTHKKLAAWRSDESAPLTSIAISPDKKLLAVGNGKGRQEDKVFAAGEVIVYDISNLAKK